MLREDKEGADWTLTLAVARQCECVRARQCRASGRGAGSSSPRQRIRGSAASGARYSPQRKVCCRSSACWTMSRSRNAFWISSESESHDSAVSSQSSAVVPYLPGDYCQ